MSPKFGVGDKVGHLLCPGVFFVSSVFKGGSGVWVYHVRISMKDEPLEKYWVYEAGLKDPGIIEGGKLLGEAYGIIDCLEENLYPWTSDQSWDKEEI